VKGILTSEPDYEVIAQVETYYKVARPKKLIKIVDLPVADLTGNLFVCYPQSQ
jgi:hypothetical protein